MKNKTDINVLLSTDYVKVSRWGGKPYHSENLEPSLVTLYCIPSSYYGNKLSWNLLDKWEVEHGFYNKKSISMGNMVYSRTPLEVGLLAFSERNLDIRRFNGDIGSTIHKNAPHGHKRMYLDKESEIGNKIGYIIAQDISENFLKVNNLSCELGIGHIALPEFQIQNLEDRSFEIIHKGQHRHAENHEYAMISNDFDTEALKKSAQKTLDNTLDNSFGRRR